MRPVEESESVEDEKEFEELTMEGNAPSLVVECLLFCCRVYSSLGLSAESAKILQLIESGPEMSLLTRVRVWNEVVVSRLNDG